MYSKLQQLYVGSRIRVKPDYRQCIFLFWKIVLFLFLIYF